MKKYIALAFAFCASLTLPSLSIASPPMSSPPPVFDDLEDNLRSETQRNNSVFNPSDSNRQAQGDSSSRATSRASGTPNRAGFEEFKAKLNETPYFHNPSIFLDNNFGGTNDNRPFGLRSDFYRMMVGFDFLTYWDVVAGFMFTYSTEDGEANDALLDLNTEEFLYTFYLGKNFIDWINVGATFSFGDSELDQQTVGTGSIATTNIDSYSPSVYVGVAHSWDSWAFASTFSYIYQEEHWNPGGGTGRVASYNQSSGVITLNNEVTYYPGIDWLDLTAFFNWTHILHENNVSTAPAGSDNDRSWGTIGARARVYATPLWSFNAGAEYEVLNKNYEESWTATVGTTYSF